MKSAKNKISQTIEKLLVDPKNIATKSTSKTKPSTKNIDTRLDLTA